MISLWQQFYDSKIEINGKNRSLFLFSHTAVAFRSLVTVLFGGFFFWFSSVLIRKKRSEEELTTKHPEGRCFFTSVLLTWSLLYQHPLNSFLSLLCLVLIFLLCEPMNSFLLCLSFLWNEKKMDQWINLAGKGELWASFQVPVNSFILTSVFWKGESYG